MYRDFCPCAGSMCGAHEKCIEYMKEHMDMLEKALDINRSKKELEYCDMVIEQLAAECFLHILLVSDRRSLEILQSKQRIQERMHVLIGYIL